MDQDLFNQLLKHPFINKTEVAALMRPESGRTQAQRTISGRLYKNYDQPSEEIERVKAEFKALESLIKKAFK